MKSEMHRRSLFSLARWFQIIQDEALRILFCENLKTETERRTGCVQPGLMCVCLFMCPNTLMLHILLGAFPLEISSCDTEGKFGREALSAR